MNTPNSRRTSASVRSPCAALAVSALTLLASAAAEAATVGPSFFGISVSECFVGRCFLPPDTMGAVGTTQFVDITNGAVGVFDKATANRTQYISDIQFWANAGQSGTNGDSRILFDAQSQRWIATSFGASVSDIQIAVSDTANASGTWKSTKILNIAPFADFPTLGMDASGVYIGTNNFNAAGNAFLGTSLIVIPKSDLFSATPTAANRTTFNTPFPGVDQTRGFSIQGVNNPNAASGSPGHIIASDLSFSNFNRYDITNSPVAGGATRGATTNVTVTTLSNTALNLGNPLGRQPNGTRIIDTSDYRISANAWEQNGRIYSVRTVGGTMANPNADFTSVRWVVLNANTNAVIQEGEIAGGGGFDYYQGSLAVNKFGQVVLGFNRSGDASTGNAGKISFMARAFNSNASGALVQEGSDLLLKQSNAYYTGTRWGDYSAVTLDPTNDESFWAIGEYVEGANNVASNNWATWVSEVHFAAAIPEPGSYALMGLGLLAVGAVRRRR